MKNLLILASCIFSLSSFANPDCEDMTHTKSWIDYHSDWNDSCNNFIKAAMEADGCDIENVYFNPIRLTELRTGSELMCIYRGERGVYQVMASQMAEPHRAVVIFSRWD